MKKKYDIIEVMTLAIAVDENQGFIKSGYGYYDVKKETNVYDNKTTIKNILNETENASDTARSLKTMPYEEERPRNYCCCELT